MNHSGFEDLFRPVRGYKGREEDGDPGACIERATVTAGPAVLTMHMCFEARVKGLLDMGAMIDDENPVLDTIKALRTQHRQRVRDSHVYGAGFGRLAARFAWGEPWEEWAEDIAHSIEQYEGFNGCADDLLTVVAASASRAAMDVHDIMVAIETVHRLQIDLLRRSMDVVRTSKAIDGVMGVKDRLDTTPVDRQREELENDGLPLHMNWREDRFERNAAAWDALALWRASRIADALKSDGIEPKQLRLSAEHAKAVRRYRETRAEQIRTLRTYLPMKRSGGPVLVTMRLDYLGRHNLRPEHTNELGAAIDEWTREIMDQRAATPEAARS